MLFLITLAAPRLLFAQIENPLRFGSLAEFLNALLDLVVSLSIPIVVVAVIYAGFLFVTAGGNEAKLTSAKKVIIWTLIGAVIILGARVIAAVVSGTVDELG